MKMELAEIAKAVQAQNDISQWQDLTVTSVAFDSRTLNPGALFVPLAGAQDGHKFVANAFENGAAAALWAADHDYIADGHPRLVVDDPLAALQALGKYYLHKINPMVVAVTGSNGKTTTKDMIAAILATQMNVTKTHANFNNDIGVPVTLLNMDASTEAVVVEMGMDHFGELDALSRLATPDIAVITMIGEAHIEFFGTRNKIADAKMEITHGLQEDGYLVFNGDEPLLQARVKELAQAHRTFGRQLDNDLYATSVTPADDHVTFKVNEWPDETFTIPVVGEYNVNNALAAMEVGRLLHVTPAHMKQALAHFDLTANRTEWVLGQNGERILSDVYNSNPTAVKEVVKTLTEVPAQGKKVLVLGDMLELGAASAELHASLADSISHEQFAEVYLIGTEMAALRDRLLAQGYPTSDLHYFAATAQAEMAQALAADLQAGDVVLLKASHGLHLEQTLAVLRQTAE